MNELLDKVPWNDLIVPQTGSPVRVYHFGQDDVISGILAKGDGTWLSWQWHKEILPVLASFFKQETTLHFIDVGANLGSYSLLVSNIFQKTSTSTSDRRRIVSVEGNKETAERLYLSILANKFDKYVTLIQNVISDEHGPQKYVNHPNNRDVMHLPGDSKFDMNEGPSLTINGIYLDDLLEVINFKRAVLKIDIEGSEYRAFRNAAKLFDNVDIPVVLMESFFKNQFISYPHVIQFFIQRNYSLFAKLEDKIPNLDVNNPNSWPRDIVWKTKPFL